MGGRSQQQVQQVQLTPQISQHYESYQKATKESSNVNNICDRPLLDCSINTMIDGLTEIERIDNGEKNELINGEINFVEINN